MKNRILLRLCGALLLLVLLCPSAAARQENASDVPWKPWYEDAVNWAISEGILPGVTPSSLHPDLPCTRAEILTCLWRTAGCPEASESAAFPDAAPSAYYAKPAAWAAARGLFSSGTQALRPSDAATRGEVLLLLWRFAGSPTVSAKNPFRDLTVDALCCPAACWAAENGIVRGVAPGRLAPELPCTRAQLLTLLWRLQAALPAQPTQPEQPEQAEDPTQPEQPTQPTQPEQLAKKLVVIDPGHQLHADSATEPNGPGSTVQKARVSGGTYGSASQTHEYELNLAVALLLRTELEGRGYRVLLTRTSNDVSISNVERAQFANSAHADAVIRIHANGSNDPAVSGAETICITSRNPYCPGTYASSRSLSDEILTAFCAATGAKRKAVWETDTMTGLNWSTVPTTILEMGYMTNRQEDLNMASDAYRRKMVQGIADGLDAYFEQ